MDELEMLAELRRDAPRISSDAAGAAHPSARIDGSGRSSGGLASSRP
jgi:hypothetical protein